MFMHVEMVEIQALEGLKSKYGQQSMPGGGDGFDDGDARRAAGDKKRSALWVDPLKPREIGPTHVRRTLILEVLEKIAAQRHFAINRTIALLFERINGHYATLHKGQARSH